MKKRYFLALLLLALAPRAPAQQPAQANLTAQAASCPTTGPGATTSSLIVRVQNTQGGYGINLSGTWSGTVSFFGTTNGQTGWSALAATPINGNSAVTTSTANGNWQVNSAGLQGVCVLVTTYSSGTVAASIIASNASARTNGGTGGETGTVTHTTGALVQGEPSIGSGSTTSDIASSPAYLDCSQFSGADWTVQVQACLSALHALNAAAGIADARGIASGGTDGSVNPEAGTMPNSGTLLLGPGTYTINVPFVDHNKWSVVGEALVNDTSGNGTFLKTGAGFSTTAYTTGTITVGTPGASEVITGSGTTWASSMVGCEFYGANGATNSTFGIIASVSSATSLTLNWGANNGTGAVGGSSYTIACALHAHGGGASSSAGDQSGMSLQNIGLNCNNNNIIGDLNWYGNQGTRDTDVYIAGCNSIGLDVEYQYQQSGPWGPITIYPGAACTSHSMNIVVRGNLQSFYGFNGVSQGKGACATSPNQGIDVGATGANFSFVDNEFLTLGLGVDLAPTCAVACAMPPAAVGNL